MERLYNSKYEIRPRIMLLAAYDPARDFSKDQLITFDFMTVYSHEFVADGHNLHGDNVCLKSVVPNRQEYPIEGLLLNMESKCFRYY